MSHTTSGSGSEDKDQADSSFLEETSSSRKKSGGGRTSLKKGPWTSAEDAILVEYVRTYGEGNWNSVQKQSGLSRCGKSCRLRWANHLRGNLKKGTFTAEEERLIVELHSKFGNKWALMAAYLPGRTDNEIKNYWNTRVKRCQRAGLPLYPPDLCLQTLNESLQVQATDEFLSPEPQNQGAHEKNYDIPDVIFDHFEGNQSLLSLPPTIPDLSSVSSMLTQGPIPSQTYGLQPSTPPAKRFRPETFLPDFSFGAELPPGSMELELPSLQYPDHGMGNWNTTSVQAALLDNIDAFLESLSPSQILSEPILSDCSSPMNNLLLDALLYEAQILNYNNNQSSEKSSASCVGTPGDIVDGLDVVFSDPGWEEFVDPVLPLGSSVASICTEHAPVSGPGSSQEQQAPKDLTGFYVKPEWVEQVATSDGRKESNEKSKTDALLTMDWSEIAECFKDQSNVLYDLSTLLGGDGWN